MRSAKHPEKIDIEPRAAALAAYLRSQDDIKRPDLHRLLALEAGISGICREDDVNVLALNDADVMLQFRVLETGRPLFEREPNGVSDFREYVLKIHD